MKRLLSLGLAAAALAGLAACSDDNTELSDWMAQQHKEVKPNVPPLFPPKKFNPQPYEGMTGVEPFGQQKLAVASGQTDEHSNALLAAAKSHAPQELESYPLDSMTMVGTLRQGGKSHALLLVDGRLHDVKVGDWIGQNYGHITNITDTEITLHETVQDATGEWIDRTSTLQIQEKAR
ncbi:MAG TPA: pilus assembly protein PilP [Burkholderiaceae bacterium]